MNILGKIMRLYLIILIFLICSIYNGYSYDFLIGRGEFAGRFTITDARVELAEYIGKTVNGKNFVVVSDNFMAKIIAGILGLRPYYTGMMNYNVKGQLYPYFYRMMRNPNIATMLKVMERTESSVGFYVVGLDDWKWWTSKENWISNASLERLKLMANEWKVFGEDKKLYLFKFINPLIEYNKIVLEESWECINFSRWSIEMGDWSVFEEDHDGDFELVSVSSIKNYETWQ